jgi:hypothetical protein
VLLHVLTRFFTHTDETDEQLDTLVQGFDLMAGVLRPLGTALTLLPAGPGHPARTAGPAFEMYYQMGNFVPWRDAAWALLAERVAVLCGRCRDGAGQDGAPAAAAFARVAAHVPAALRPG